MGQWVHRVFRFALSLIGGVVYLSSFAVAQSPASGPAAPSAPGLESKPWYTLGRVTTWTGSPVAGAEISVFVEPKADTETKLQTDLHGEFEISLPSGPSDTRHLRVVARKKGFRQATEFAEPDPQGNSEMMDLVLRADEDEDPDQLSFRDLTHGVNLELAARAEPPIATAGRKETLESIGALLETGDPDRALTNLSKALDREPQSVEFHTLRGLAMLEDGSWSGATRQLTHTLALNASLAPQSRRAEPLLILGVMQTWRANPPGALDFFHQALEVDAPSPLLFQEIGRAELLNRSFPEAEADLGRAIQLGAPPDARMLRAGALLGQGKTSEAKAELGAYLGDRKPKQLPTHNRIAWLKLNDRLKLILDARANTAKPVVKLSLDELLAVMPELQGLEPAKDQQELATILQKAGERVESFFNDFRNTTSKERIGEESLGSNDKVKSSLNATYQYWLLTFPDFGHPALKEYRTAPKENQQVPEASQAGLMLTEGFASASNLLLPAFQKESDFAYLGRQSRDGRATYVLAFAQRPEVARLEGGFRNEWNGDLALTLSQGVVWIDCRTYHVVRLRTDLLFPIPKQHLDRLTTDIQYGEVHFGDPSHSLWLPQEVVVTVESKKKLLRNRHTYSDYRMFNVQSKITVVDDTAK